MSAAPARPATATHGGPQPAAAGHLNFDQLAGVAVCLALAMVPAITALPAWLTLAVAAAVLLRLAYAWRGRDEPPAILRLLVSLGSIVMLGLQYGTFNGLGPGRALLCLLGGLKLLEARGRRDIQVIVMIVYFLCLAALLEGESFWLLAYLIGVCWLTTSALLRLRAASSGDWRRSLRHAGRLLLQALPIALAFWLFFPRFDGPLWQLPEEPGGARSGLSDSMSPGDITDLALSDEVAFRVRFDGSAPPPRERYWRGPVLHDFDGRTWRRMEAGPQAVPTLLLRGPAYRYTVSLEPTQHDWLFVLDRPASWDAAHAVFTGDFMLLQPGPLTRPLDLLATSYPEAGAADPPTPAARRRDTLLPPDRNRRTLALARRLRAAHPDDRGYVDAVLDLFRREPFFYTLTPARLDADPVDGFLFDTRRGFCGHYASAFATLMRAGGIPARVVTGYQGGTYNRFAGYWILRQSDAHAWDEIWLDGLGWSRVDPTAAVAPERVEHGLNDLVTAGAPLVSRWQQRTPWLSDLRLRLDALRQVWRERILRFDSRSQDALLAWLQVPEPDGQKLALALALCLVAGMFWLTWQVRRDARVRPRDAVVRAFERLCGRLAAIGIERRPHEGALDFAARVSRLRPDLGTSITALCREYSALRYGPARAQRDPAGFAAAVRRFRPRRPARPRGFRRPDFRGS
jgi:transglutaminase-like putative cysteine protease